MSFLDDFIATSYVGHIYGFWESAVYAILIPLGFILGKFLFALYYKVQISTFDLNDQLVEKDNKATAVAFAGFQCGLGLVMWGAIADQDPKDSVKNLYGGIAWTFIGIVYYLLAAAFNDRVMLRSLTIVPEVERGNIATGLVVAGNYVAAGLVCLYTIGGGGSNWGENLGSSLLFFVLCQLEFCVFYFAIRWAFRRYGAIDTHIRAGNVAIGTIVCISRIGISVMATNPLRTTEELLAFFIWFGCGLIALVFFEIFGFHILLSSATVVEDVVRYENWGAAAVHSSSLVMFCTACMSFMPGQCREGETSPKPLSDRLTTTNFTMDLIFRWPNLVSLAFVFLYVVASKYIFALPGILHRMRMSNKGAGVPWVSAFRNYLRLPRRGCRGDQTIEVVAFTDALGSHGSLANLKKRDGNGTEMSKKEQIQRELDDLDALLDAPPPPAAASATGDNTAAASTATTAAAAQNHPTETAEESEADHAQLVAQGGSGKIAIGRALSFSGYLISIGILLRSAIAVSNQENITAGSMLMYSGFYIAIGIVMQHLGYFLLRFLLWGTSHPVSGLTEAAGILDACIYVVCGMNVGSNLLGNNEPGPYDLAADTATTLLFFVLQIICVVIAGKIFQVATVGYDDKQAVAENNVAVAVANGMSLLAAGILTQQFGQRTVEIAALVSFFFPALLLMHINRKVVNGFVIMRSQSLDKELFVDKNWGAALVSGTISCMLCACYSTFVREVCPAKATTLPPVPLTSIPPSP